MKAYSKLSSHADHPQACVRVCRLVGAFAGMCEEHTAGRPRDLVASQSQSFLSRELNSGFSLGHIQSINGSRSYLLNTHR
jgi:hypothetical protein